MKKFWKSLFLDENIRLSEKFDLTAFFFCIVCNIGITAVFGADKIRASVYHISIGFLVGITAAVKVDLKNRISFFVYAVITLAPFFRPLYSLFFIRNNKLKSN